MVRRSRLIIGLNSGTSADGVDAVACEIAGRGLNMKVRVVGHVSRPYPDGLRDRLLAAMAPAHAAMKELCRLDVEVGEAFAHTAAAVVKKYSLRRVDVVGSHGQTICHLPPHARAARGAASRRVFGTMQIGDPTRIAARLKCPIVHHFRQADMAVGGQGAPLVPWTDFVLFGDRRATRLVQNIGGIANLTWLPAGGTPDQVVAFDTGPGNMIIDALVTEQTDGRIVYDAGGRIASRGRVDEELLRVMLRHPFFRPGAPASGGREQFGRQWVRHLRQRFRSRRIFPADWVRTATEFTARSIVNAWIRLTPRTVRRPAIEEVLLCGGGAKNRTLVSRLRALCHDCESLRGVRVTAVDEYGISTQAKEGASFAMLAAACLDGVPANLPQVTGARRRVVLGSVCRMEERR